MLKDKTKEELIEIVENLQRINNVNNEIIRVMEKNNDDLKKQINYWQQRAEMA